MTVNPGRRDATGIRPAAEQRPAWPRSFAGRTVRALDAYNNLATNNSSLQVSWRLARTPAAVTLSGTNPVTVSSGVATFNNLAVSQDGTGDTLVASASGVSSATSNAFNVASSTTVTLEGFETPTITVWQADFP